MNQSGLLKRNCVQRVHGDARTPVEQAVHCATSTAPGKGSTRDQERGLSTCSHVSLKAESGTSILLVHTGVNFLAGRHKKFHWKKQVNNSNQDFLTV